MTVEQFLGVFILWGGIAAGVILVKLGIEANLRWGKGKGKGKEGRVLPPAKEKEPKKKAAAAEETAKVDPVEIPGRGSEYPDGLDINNTSAMLRYLVLANHAKESGADLVNDLRLSSP